MMYAPYTWCPHGTDEAVLLKHSPHNGPRAESPARYTKVGIVRRDAADDLCHDLNEAAARQQIIDEAAAEAEQLPGKPGDVLTYAPNGWYIGMSIWDREEGRWYKIKGIGNGLYHLERRDEHGLHERTRRRDQLSPTVDYSAAGVHTERGEARLPVAVTGDDVLESGMSVWDKKTAAWWQLDVTEDDLVTISRPAVTGDRRDPRQVVTRRRAEICRRPE